MIRAYGGAILVEDSTVEGEQRSSGLLVPYAAEGDVQLTRAVVVDCGPAVEVRLEPGTAVYYSAALTDSALIGNLRVINHAAIVAIEEL
jgi:hypothetical protein